MNNKTNILDVLTVMQVCDSNFPVGSFNHSYGMETYIRDRRIDDSSAMKEWLKAYLNNVFIYSDGLAVRMTYDCLDKNDIKEIWNIDNEITVQCVSSETRNGSKLVAARMIRMFELLHDSSLLQEYDKRIADKKSFGHPAIVFSIVMHSLGFSMEETLNFHMYSTVSTLIQNSVRAIPLGQKDGQLLMKECSESFSRLAEKVNNMSYDMFGASSPGIELSQIKHEILEFRLFMS